MVLFGPYIVGLKNVLVKTRLTSTMNNQAEILSQVCGLDYFISSHTPSLGSETAQNELVVLAQFEPESKAQQLLQEILDYFQLKSSYMVPFSAQQSLDDALPHAALEAIESGAGLMIFADREKLPLTKAKIRGNMITTLCIKKLLHDGNKKKQLFKLIQKHRLLETR